MAIVTQSETEVYADIERGDGVEALQSVLEAERHEDVSYTEAAALGEALLTFIEALCGDNDDAREGS